MNIQGKEYEVKSKAKVRLVELIQTNPTMTNQILFIKNILEPNPSEEDIDEMDTEDFDNVLVEFAKVNKKKNTEYKKKLSI